jgi:hypothetical protein|tara:strand:- start:24763 stop:24978 length:216 start_codon:yes stop_codon:yes gene_type:complete
MPTKDKNRKKVRTQVCKINKKGVKKCTYKMVKRTPKELKAYDKMKSRGANKSLSDLDVSYPTKVIDKRKKK